MYYRFYISGMTCMRCQNSVKEKINTIEEVDSVKVTLESGLAEIQSKTKLSIVEISALLGPKYSVQEEVFKTKGVKTSKFKELRPLIFIFILLVMVTLFLSYQLSAHPKKAMQIFMGLFFIFFSFFKFLDYQGFPDSFKQYDPLAKRIPGYAKVYPFIEMILGLSFLLEWQLPLTLLLTMVILSFTTFGVLNALMQKSQINCACLGTAFKLPMTEATLIENGIMLIMSNVLLLDYFI